jgi:pimeloyl-ACP methyl ester carboxylesterase
VRVAYDVRGEGPPDIIVAPGIVSHLNIMGKRPPNRRTLDSLARFARAVAFDERGQGLSDPTLEAPSLEERPLDIEAIERVRAFCAEVCGSPASSD